MSGRIEKTVFISYRRTNFPWAYCIYQDLTHHGFDVFFDYQSIDSGNFEKVILENIRARAHFVIILSPSALERCDQPGDWLRCEIETALDEQRNIIPVMLEGFDFGSSSVRKALTGKLVTLSNFSGLNLISEYVEAGFDKLRNRFLNVALEDVHLHVLTESTKEITESQKVAANEAPSVEREQLTAQDWFERGYKTIDKDDKIRCYTESIRLDPNFAEAFYQRGSNWQDSENLDCAIADYTEAIRLRPDYSEAFNNRGNARRNKNEFDSAIDDYTKSIKFNNPKLDLPYCNRGNVLKNLGDLSGAIADYSSAIKFNPNSVSAYHYRGEVYKILGKLNDAEKDYQEVILLDPSNVVARASLVSVLYKLGRDLDAIKHEQKVQDLIKKENEYNRACFESIIGNTEQGIKLLEIALKKDTSLTNRARNDIDFDNIRKHPHFLELIGE